jgi:predicted glycogen debranching enzyme
MRASAGEFARQPLMFHNVVYRREAERGFDFVEELFSPGAFTAVLEPNRPLVILAGAAPLPAVDVEAEEREERARLETLVSEVGPQSPLERQLILASDAFVVHGENNRGAIMAGYHWFDSWGRDSFISLEGLTLITRRFDDARSILAAYAERVVEGMVPNFLAADPRHDALNSADAALWFIHAIARFAHYTNDFDFVREHLWATVKGILAAYAHGAKFNIHADADGLLIAGTYDTQLTWMDAKVHGQAVTARQGKPVEINALWYNALRTAAALAEKFEEPETADEYRRQAFLAQVSFNRLFWSGESGCLCDCVADDIRDARLRPNQALAISLPYPALEQRHWRPVVETLRQHLYTPFGLRTLAATEPGYQPRCQGSSEMRDRAYHQGTVWAWLLGPFYEAYLKTYGFNEMSRQTVKQGLSVWSGHMNEAGLGQISEIFDGDAPNWPRGAIAQAWSVAEVLRISRLLAGQK